MQDGGGGRKEKMSLGTIQNEFAMRFSVNQGFHCGWPEMSSLVFYSASTKVVPVFSHPQILKETSDVYTTRTGSVRMLRQRPLHVAGLGSPRADFPVATAWISVYAQLVELDPFCDIN